MSQNETVEILSELEESEHVEIEQEDFEQEEPFEGDNHIEAVDANNFEGGHIETVKAEHIETFTVERDLPEVEQEAKVALQKLKSQMKRK